MSERRVALVKSAGRADAFAVALRAAGCVPVLVSPFQREALEEGEQELGDTLVYALGLSAGGGLGGSALPGAAGPLPGPRRLWVAVTSAHAVPALERLRDVLAGARIAAVGGGTATALHAAGLAADVVGDAGGAALARRMIDAGLTPGDMVVHPCAESVRPELADVLDAAGVTLRAIAVYRMVPDAVGERAARGAFCAVVVGSPRLAARAAALFPERPPAVAVGRTTAAALRDLGWPPAAVAASPSPQDVAAAVTNVT